MKFSFLFLVALFCLNSSYSQEEKSKITVDSINYYIENSTKNNFFSKKDRLNFALRAKKISVNLGIDSIVLKSNKALSDVYLQVGLDDQFEKISNENFDLANKIKDTISLASIHYSRGEFYRLKKRFTDSAYFHYHNAEKLYKNLNDNYNIANTLLRIAIIQKNEKDFTGSELTSVEAILLLNQLEESNKINECKAYLLNNLGLVLGQLEEYDESISYYKKSLHLKGRLVGNNNASIGNSKNNLALSYKNSGQYDLAITQYDKILKNKNLIEGRPDFYVLVLDNYANALYLSGNLKQIPKLYLKALKISDSVDYEGYNSIIVNQHLAEYYNDKNNKDSALYYAYRAKRISEKYHNDDLLKSLRLLSKIEEGDLSAKHLEEYVTLNDSLQKAERRVRNKFARIRFNTNQIEQENKRIAKERMWLFIISVTLVIASFLVYLFINQRNKNKELQFVQKQQETNEEIYNLMLSQNESIEEARALEKKRISEELHDGVLGRLFGTRLSLDSLNMNSSVKAIKARGQYIDELKNIEEDIRKVSHELNTDFVSGSGFIDIIKTLVETQTQTYSLDYELKRDYDIDWDNILNKKKIHIYRIIQETLHNIYKHAKATEVKISFKLKNNVICLIMSDNGSGFDVGKTKSGIGLKNMKSRINDISGTIDITSKKDVGTTVALEVPIP